MSWTQPEGLRRLAYALRPLIDQGLGAHDIAAELHAWHLDRPPASPAAFLIARLRERAARETTAPGHHGVPSPEFTVAAVRVRGAEAGYVTGVGTTRVPEPLTVEDLSRAEVIDLRSAAVTDPGLVRAAVDLLGEEQARRLYTHCLVRQARARGAL
ncbi:hypothetical protein [Streptomyces halstedii]|uniref:hypothetical protein n=1 Tax=Streptomyces halstedii TaxID=1944 RepID=UPI0036BDB1BE